MCTISPKSYIIFSFVRTEKHFEEKWRKSALEDTPLPLHTKLYFASNGNFKPLSEIVINVYLLVRQLPYTAKAQKSFDGNKNFQLGSAENC